MPKSSLSGSMTARQRGILIVCLIASFFSPFMGAALNLSVTDISSQFNCGATTVTWVVNAYTITLAVSVVPFGHLADVASRRRLMLTGMAAFALISLACALSLNVTMLIAFRVVQAVASAAIFSVNIPLLLDAFPPQQKGRMLGLSVTATYTGLALGPVLGGFLNSVLGWRSIFALGFLLSLGAFWLAYKNVEPDQGRKEAHPDRLGNVLYVLGVSCLMLGLSNWTAGWWSKLLVLLSFAWLALFVRNELQAASPVIQVRLFAQDRAYTLSNLAALLNYGATFAISYSLSIYLQNVKDMPSSLAGVVLICQPLTMAAFSSLAGRLSDRIAPYKLASFGMLVITAGLLYLSWLRPETPLWSIVIALLVIGFGFGFFSSPNTNAVLSCVDKSHYGEANSILGTMRTLGQSSSMVMVLLIFGAYIGNTVISQADPLLLTAAIRRNLQISCLICFVGALISLVRGRAAKGGR
ncbi:MAG: MFS transporter [Firmicutes bacterium]|nr:MFS transporter [Bacillota bacterium]